MEIGDIRDGGTWSEIEGPGQKLVDTERDSGHMLEMERHTERHQALLEMEGQKEKCGTMERDGEDTTNE